MTDREINRLIAEACPTVAGVGSDGELRWNYKLRPVPTCFDPVNDLNAMHEAVLAMPHWWQDRFTMELTRHCGSHKLAVNASARQRAEVFLHTSAKWRASEQAALDKSPPA